MDVWDVRVLLSFIETYHETVGLFETMDSNVKIRAGLRKKIDSHVFIESREQKELISLCRV